VKDLKLSEVPKRIIVEAIIASGITDDEEVHQIALDFASDTYWNDPKCARRRIIAHNGDRFAFFDYLEGVDWGED